MKILYITSQVSDDGGVQRVLSVKTNCFLYKMNSITSLEGFMFFIKRRN